MTDHQSPLFSLPTNDFLRKGMFNDGAPYAAACNNKVYVDPGQVQCSASQKPFTKDNSYPQLLSCKIGHEGATEQTLLQVARSICVPSTSF